MANCFNIDFNNQSFRRVRILANILAGIFLLFTLQSCSTPYKSKKHKSSVDKSVDKINEMVIESKKGADDIPDLKDDLLHSKISSQKSPIQLLNNSNSYADGSISDLKKGRRGIYRVPEKVIKIWLSGYETDEGDYVDAHNVFVVLKDSSWKEELR